MAPSPFDQKIGRFSSLLFSRRCWIVEGIRAPSTGMSCSLGSGEMSNQFVLSTGVLYRSIDRHLKARKVSLKVEGWTRPLWSPLRRLLRDYPRRNELSALHSVVVTRPIGADQAREKLFYLMALTIADGADPGKADLVAAIETLRPFQTELTGLWQPGRSPAEPAS